MGKFRTGVLYGAAIEAVYSDAKQRDYALQVLTIILSDGTALNAPGCYQGQTSNLPAKEL